MECLHLSKKATASASTPLSSVFKGMMDTPPPLRNFELLEQ